MMNLENWIACKVHIFGDLGDLADTLIVGDEYDVTPGQWVLDDYCRQAYMIDSFPRVPVAGDRILTDYKDLIVRQVCLYGAWTILPDDPYAYIIDCDIVPDKPSAPYDKAEILRQQLEKDLEGSSEDE